MSDAGFYIGTERVVNPTGSIFIGGLSVPNLDRTTYHNAETLIVDTLASSTSINLRFGQGIDIDKGRIIVGNESGNFDGKYGKIRSLRIQNWLDLNYDFNHSGSTFPSPHQSLEYLSDAIRSSSNGGNGANFGKSVATSQNHIVAGAPNFGGFYDFGNNANYQKGTAYLYRSPGGFFTSTRDPEFISELPDPNPSSTKNFFGDTVAIGNNIVAVATGYDSFGGNSGRVCVFDFSGTHLYTLTGDGFSSGENNAFGSGSFSNSLAIGHGRIVVGASNEDNDLGDGEGTRNTGAVYVYDVKNGIRLFKLLPPATQNPGYTIPNDVFGTSQNSYDPSHFGISVAIGCGKIVVGDAYADYGGWVHVYDIYGNYERSFNSGKGGATDVSDRFGASVAIGGGYIAVGADSDDDGGGNHITAKGSVTLFDLNGNEYFTLDPASPAADMEYGSKVRIGSGKLLVSAVGFGTQRGNETLDGAVFFYELEENTDSLVDRLIEGYKY